jgi:hypothetical protein
MTTEPQIVTLAKMSTNLEARVAEAEAAHADACEEGAREALAVERGDEAALRRLARAEKRRDSAADELGRLRLAKSELARQLAAERDATEADSQRELLIEYAEHRNFVQDAGRQLFEAVAAMEPVVQEARERAKAAKAVAHQLGLLAANEGAYLPEFGAARGAFKAVLGDGGSARGRMLADARERVERDWKDTADGRRVTDLLAALGEGAGKAE